MFSSWIPVMDGGKKEDRQEDLSCELLLDNVSPVSFLSRWTCKINYPEDLEIETSTREKSSTEDPDKLKELSLEIWPPHVLAALRGSSLTRSVTSSRHRGFLLFSVQRRCKSFVRFFFFFKASRPCLRRLDYSRQAVSQHFTVIFLYCYKRGPSTFLFLFFSSP